MSADNLCKQFGHRLGQNECRSWSGPNHLTLLIVFLKETFEKVNLEKSHQMTTKAWKITQHAKSQAKKLMCTLYHDSFTSSLHQFDMIVDYMKSWFVCGDIGVIFKVIGECYWYLPISTFNVCLHKISAVGQFSIKILWILHLDMLG